MPRAKQKWPAFVSVTRDDGAIVAARIDVRACVRQETDVRELLDELAAQAPTLHTLELADDVKRQSIVAVEHVKTRLAAFPRLERLGVFAPAFAAEFVEALAGAPLLSQLREVGVRLEEGSPGIEALRRHAAAFADVRPYPDPEDAIEEQCRFARVLGRELERRDEARALLERMRDASDDADALFEIGNTLDDLGFVDEAVASWQKLVELDPSYAPGWYNLGVAAKDRQRFNEAIEMFDRACELDPDDAATLHCRGHMYQEIDDERGREDLERAVELYGEAIADEPDDAELLFWRGAARARLGERDAALADLAAAIVLDPDRRDQARSEVDYAWLSSDPEFIRLTSEPAVRRSKYRN